MLFISSLLATLAILIKTAFVVFGVVLGASIFVVCLGALMLGLIASAFQSTYPSDH